ncbi:ribokinase [Coraliomargarita sp. W4R72]
MQNSIKKILVVGSSNTDMIAQVKSLPAEGETIMGFGFDQFVGGKGANQAVAAARSGAPVSFACCVGDDHFGGVTLEKLKLEGLDLSYAKQVKGTPSGLALIAVDEEGRNQIVVIPGANAALDEAQIDQIDFSAFEVVVFQLETPAAAVWYGLRQARAAGCTTIFNPAPAAEIPEDVLPLIDYLIPNEHELKVIAPQGGSRLDCANGLLAKGAGAVIVTLGGDGVACFQPRGVIEVPAPVVDVVDTVGAGDAFVGTFAAALARGKELQESLILSVCSASLSVQKSGVQASYAHFSNIEAMAAVHTEKILH